MQLDKKINLEDDLNKAVSKVNKTIDIIPKLRDVLPRLTPLTIYKSLISPHLHYGVIRGLLTFYI